METTTLDDTATKRTVLIIASISNFLVPFIGASAQIALPTIGQEFKIDAILLSWVATSQLLATAMFLLPFGRIADIYGGKKIFLYGMIVYTLGSLMSAVSVSILILIIGRVIQGIGSALTMVTSFAILTSVYPREERGAAIGITVASVYTGLSLGPFLGGLLTQHLGWRSIFWVNVPLGLGVIILVLWQLKGEWAEARGERVDLPGSILYAFALLLGLYGLTRLPSNLGIGLTVAGGMGAFAFFFVEARTKSPVLDVRGFRSNLVFTFSNLAALIHYCSTYGVSFLMSFYLQYIKGLSPQNAGLILICQPIMMALFSPLAGRLSDRMEPRIISSLGMFFTSLGIFLLSFIGNTTGLSYIVFDLIVIGLGFAFFSSPNTNAVMSSVEKRYLGIASGTLGTMRVIGQALSMGVIMMVFSIIIGKVRITPELYPQFLESAKIALTIMGTLCFMGIFSSMARGKVRMEEENKKKVEVRGQKSGVRR
jgi:EmrB/QacA subfamily drug resistance transporter